MVALTDQIVVVKSVQRQAVQSKPSYSEGVYKYLLNPSLPCNRFLLRQPPYPIPAFLSTYPRLCVRSEGVSREAVRSLPYIEKTETRILTGKSLDP